MILCENCGIQIESESKFCPNCGSSIQANLQVKVDEAAENLIEEIPQEELSQLEEEKQEQSATLDVDIESIDNNREDNYDFNFFKKIDETDSSAQISFKKLDENEVFQPVDRLAPIKNKINETYNNQIKVNLNKINGYIKDSFSKANKVLKNKVNQLKGLDRKRVMKIGIISSVSLLLVLSSIIAINVYLKSEHRAFAIAEKYEKQQEYSKAVEAYKEILEKDSGNLIAKEKIGFIYLDNLQKYELAEEYLREVALLSDSSEIKERMKSIFPIISVNPTESEKVYSDLITVELFATGEDTKIYYSTSSNGENNSFVLYDKPIELEDGKNVITAKAISFYGYESESVSFSFNVDLADKFVTFDNRYLENKIKIALDKSEDSRLKESDMNGIYSLYIIGDKLFINEEPVYMNTFNNEEVAAVNWGDLSELNKLINLKELSIYSQLNITTFNFISNMSNLEKLIISNSNISDFKFIKGNSKLTYLDLSNNNIGDLNGIQNLSQLKYLNLTRNSITDVYHISNLINLTHLFISENPIEDVSVLKNLKNLEELALTTQNKYEYEFLANMNKLKKVDLGNYSKNKAYIGGDGRDLSALSKLTSLEYLSLAGCGIKKIEALGNLSNLKKLDLSYNNVIGEELEIINKISNLEILNLENNSINEALPDFTNLKKLKSLNLSYNPRIENVESSSFTQTLEVLLMKGVRLSSFSDIASMSSLKHLDLENNYLTEVTLGQMTNLEYLNLGKNKIKKLPDIYKLPNIKVLIFNNNPIEDISELNNVGSISLILMDLSNCRIKDASPFAKMKTLQYLDVSNNNEMVNMSAFDDLDSVMIIPYNATKESIPSELLKAGQKILIPAN